MPSWIKWLVMGRRISIFGSLISFCLLVAVSGFILQTRYNRSGEEIDVNAKEMAEILNISAAILIWNLDNDALESIRTQSVKGYIEAITFKGKDGKPIIPEKPAKSTSGLIKYTKDITDKKGEKLGQIEISYNKNDQWTGFISDAKIFLGGVLIIMIAQACSLLGVWIANKKTIGSLGELISYIKNTATVTSNKASSVKNAAVNVNSSATEQSAAVHETMSAITEISATMKKSLEHVDKSTQTVAEGNDLAIQGKDSVVNVISAVNQINSANEEIFSQVETSNQQLREIVQIIQEISQKTKVINDIVFQTKLLSFNASVEAARAGESGKGFAVVAEEVGNLAAMSGKASSEIDRLLRESVQKTEAIVASSTDRIGRAFSSGKEKVQHGVVVAQECDKILDQLVEKVQDFKFRMDEIKQSTYEQTDAIQNITKAVAMIDESSRSNLQNAGIVEGDSDSVASESQRLADVVGAMEEALYGSKKKDSPPTSVPVAEQKTNAKTYSFAKRAA